MPRYLSRSEENLNIRFVKEIEKYPCLYNHTLEEYSKKYVIEAAWQKIAEVFDDTVANCKEKWKNLRTVFVRKRRSSMSGSARKNPYYLNEVMQFIIPHIKVQYNDGIPCNIPSPGSFDNTELTFSDVEDDQELTEQEHFSKTQRHTNNTVQKIAYQNKEYKKTENDSSTFDSPMNSKENKVKQKLDVVVDEVFIEYLRERKKQINIQTDSARKSFLLSLVPDVENMTDIQFRMFRRHVLDAIEKVLTPTL